MKIDILTLFPEMFQGILKESILKRAQEINRLEVHLHNFRDDSLDPHKKVDDTPYGGGCGMVLSCQAIFDCVRRLRTPQSKVILLTPDGMLYHEKMAIDLSKEKHLIMICGHYEGFDERIRSLCDLEVSIGDYVLTGGEIPAMVLVDSIARLLPGVIKRESFEGDSFYDGLLDYPTYTKPRVYEGMAVPDVLLSGNHALIEKYRREEQIKRTRERRPDLMGDKDGDI